jgi:formate dehydrogenase subunit gamma
MVLGHMYMANRDPYALRGMRTGYVSTSWAQREHKAWALREIERTKATKGS